jgi:hypothetical protein
MTGEPGIDAGGLEREWFGLVVEAMFSPSAGMFVSSAGDSLTGIYHINPLSGLINPDHLSYFKFAGRLFGKAFMEQQSIAAMLSVPIRKQMLGLPITFSDLEFVDLDVFQHLSWLRTENAINVEDLSIDFTVTYESHGLKCTYDLLPNGSQLNVTNENKEEYLELRFRHRILDSVKPQLECLLRGFYCNNMAVHFE